MDLSKATKEEVEKIYTSLSCHFTLIARYEGFEEEMRKELISPAEEGVLAFFSAVERAKENEEE